MAEDAALLAGIETLAIFFEALSFAAFAPSADLLQLQAQAENGRYLLNILSEGPGVSGQGLEDGFLVCLIFVHVSAADAVAIGGAKYLQVEALTVHLQAFGLATVAPPLLHLTDFLQTLSLLRTAAHLPTTAASLLPTVVSVLGKDQLPAEAQRRGRAV